MKEKTKLNFITYVFMLYQSGLIALGKLENPITKKTSVELEEVKGVVELLQLLEEKTKGNLNSEEARTLSMLLSTLQLNYVEESNRKTKNGSDGKAGEKNEEIPEVH